LWAGNRLVGPDQAASFLVQAIVVTVLVTVGAVVFLGLARIVRVQELGYVLNLVRRRPA
jgi:hypothetical protein